MPADPESPHHTSLLFSSRFGRSSNTSSQINFTVSESPFSCCIGCCLIHCKLRSIHTSNFFALLRYPAFSAKDPVWVKQSRTLAFFAKFLDCQTVVLLIQEKSCLLTVLYIYLVLHAILYDLHQSRKFFDPINPLYGSIPSCLRTLARHFSHKHRGSGFHPLPELSSRSSTSISL